jgi:hypothetical protein
MSLPLREVTVEFLVNLRVMMVSQATPCVLGNIQGSIGDYQAHRIIESAHKHNDISVSPPQF